MNIKTATLLSICAIVVLAGYVYLTFDYLPIRSVMTDNADVLFSEDIARDLNAGGALFDWRLSAVTYLFPDIFVARLLAYAGVAAGEIGTVYQPIFAASLLALVYAVAAPCLQTPAIPTCLAAMLYLSAYIGNTLTNPINVHFALIGEHCGMLLEVLAAVALLPKLLEGKWPDAVTCFGLFLALFLGIISDSLASVIALPPMALYLAFLFLRKQAPPDRLTLAASTIALAVIAGRMFSYLNPFPQDRDTFRWLLHQLPGSAIASTRQFAADLVYFTVHSWISAALLVMTLAAYAGCLMSLARNENDFSPPRAFLALVGVTALPICLLLQLGFGLYGGIALARHWAPAVYLTIVIGAIVSIADWPALARHLAVFTMAATIGLTGALAGEMKGRAGQVRPEGLFADFVACLEREGRPGWLYISDYWMARPVRIYSNRRFGLVPFNADAVFTNQSNIRDIRRARPEYLVTGYNVSADPFLASFGQPKAVICEVIAAGQRVSVLDYSDNEAFKAYARSKSAIAN